MHSNIKTASLTAILLLNSLGFFATTKFGLFLTFQISLSVPDEKESFSGRAATLLPYLNRRPANLFDRFLFPCAVRQRLKSFQLVSHSKNTLKSLCFYFHLIFCLSFLLSLKFTTCLVYESRITTKNSCGVKCCCLRCLLTKRSKNGLLLTLCVNFVLNRLAIKCQRTFFLSH